METVDAALRAILTGVYGDSREQNRERIEVYTRYYGLATIERTLEVPPRLLPFYGRGEHFVVVAVANEAGEVLVTMDPGSVSEAWALVGGFIRAGEAIEDACERLVHEDTGLEIDEIEPLIAVRNEFVAKGARVAHAGLAFLARARGQPTLRPGLVGAYVSDCPGQLAYSNEEVIRLAFDRIQRGGAVTPHDEIDISKKHAGRQWIHKRIINWPFSYLVSSRLRKAINEHCAGAHTILDVACGDDSLILDLARRADLCVANDISWHTLRYLRRKDGTGRVIFTNHNAMNLPFKGRFDVVICKNTFHHVHNIDEFVSLTDNLRRVARRLIIMDIEDPTASRAAAKLWHSYYTTFLGDRGSYFLTGDEFQRALSYVYADASIMFDVVRTIKGNYNLAVIDFYRVADAAAQCPQAGAS